MLVAFTVLRNGLWIRVDMLLFRVLLFLICVARLVWGGKGLLVWADVVLCLGRAFLDFVGQLCVGALGSWILVFEI